LIKELKSHVFGPFKVRVPVYTIEYQKRGLPHMHFLLWLEPTAQFYFDEVVCAELPDPSWDPDGTLRDLVIAHMTHGPCGDDDPSAQLE
jgi:hypothetical protein